MLWFAFFSFLLSVAALSAAFLLWRRVRRLEAGAASRAASPGELERHIFESVELSLASMLEELDQKEQEILRRIGRREEELLSLIEQRLGMLGRSGTEAARPSGEALGPAPAGYAEKAAAVRRLAEQGLDEVAIAKRLGMGKGEVALILGLAKTL